MLLYQRYRSQSLYISKMPYYGNTVLESACYHVSQSACMYDVEFMASTACTQHPMAVTQIQTVWAIGYADFLTGGVASPDKPDLPIPLPANLPLALVTSVPNTSTLSPSTLPPPSEDTNVAVPNTPITVSAQAQVIAADEPATPVTATFQLPLPDQLPAGSYIKPDQQVDTIIGLALGPNSQATDQQLLSESLLKGPDSALDGERPVQLAAATAAASLAQPIDPSASINNPPSALLWTVSPTAQMLTGTSGMPVDQKPLQGSDSAADLIGSHTLGEIFDQHKRHAMDLARNNLPCMDDTFPLCSLPKKDDMLHQRLVADQDSMWNHLTSISAAQVHASIGTALGRKLLDAESVLMEGPVLDDGLDNLGTGSAVIVQNAEESGFVDLAGAPGTPDSADNGDMLYWPL